MLIEEAICKLLPHNDLMDLIPCEGVFFRRKRSKVFLNSPATREGACAPGIRTKTVPGQSCGNQVCVRRDCMGSNSIRVKANREVIWSPPSHVEVVALSDEKRKLAGAAAI